MADATVAVTSRSFSKHPVLRAELLERYPDTRFNDEGLSLRDESLVEFLSGCSKAITALEPIDDTLLGRLPGLQVISKVGVGIDMIDLDAMERHDVKLGWATGTNSRSVAELVVLLALGVLRHVGTVSAEVRGGKWAQKKGGLLSDRTVGIVGFGAVGRDLAGLVAAFGCPVLAHDVRPLDDLPPGVASVGLDELLERSDIVSLHVALNDATRGFIDARRIDLMKDTAIIINTARGGLIDEDALADALREGRLGGAGLDVFATEPPGDSPLLPPTCGSTEEAIVAMGRAAIDGLDTARTIAEIRGLRSVG